MDEVRRIKQQLTASKTSIDKAAEIVTAMADGVRGQLSEIAGLIDHAEAAAPAQDEAPTDDLAPSRPISAPERVAPAAPPRLRDELATALPSARSRHIDDGQSSLL
jgi:hypothetical protein